VLSYRRRPRRPSRTSTSVTAASTPCRPTMANGTCCSDSVAAGA